ncbi:MAG: hypothetical protein QM644_11285 [Mobilitalea sp.]
MNDFDQKTVGILYSEQVNNTVDKATIIAAINRIMEQKNLRIGIATICAETLTGAQVLDKHAQRPDLIINLLGPYYPEKGLGTLLDYYQSGGSLFNIGVKPFSIPYVINEDKADCFEETNEAIRTFRVLDEYVSTGAMGEGLKLEVLDSRYDFIRELYEAGEFPDMEETYGVNYHFGSMVEEPVEWPDQVGHIEADLITICGWRDKNNRLMSVPITKVEHKTNGALIFLNFKPQQTNYYNTQAGIKFLSGMIVQELLDRVSLSITSEYARYTERETPSLTVNISFHNIHRNIESNTNNNKESKTRGKTDINLSINADRKSSDDTDIHLGNSADNKSDRNIDNNTGDYTVDKHKDTDCNSATNSGRHYLLEVKILDKGNDELIREYSYERIDYSNDFYAQFLRIEDLKEGFYKVEAELTKNGILLAKEMTGFYKLSDKTIRETLKEFKPLTIKTSISTDFCMQGDKIYPIHGTTYFTTDVYRNCFTSLNVYLCDQEMFELKGMGFNLIRTGIWQKYNEFYEEEGSIKEVSLRALEAFFFTAARHELPVQFVLGAYVFNHWNRKQCPIHNPEAKNKTIVAFTSFAKRFGSWSNVSVDAINEPSYSIPGRWTTARPSGDEYERIHWTQWLKSKYKDDITLLRKTWSIPSVDYTSFENINVPGLEQFSRGYDRKDVYVNYAMIADFNSFAREFYSGWVAELRRAVKSANPNMLFMMGRDESLRVPSQQYEVYKGHFDMVNWHQWHEDSAIFAEYFLNRVRGIPCCAQELGVYHYDDLRGNMRMTEQEYAQVLERKLLYSFGNWVQWQLNSDPNMLDNCEIALGLLRADKSETPHMKITRLLTLIEEKMAGYMSGRQEEKVEILTIHPSTLYYSADSRFARRGILNSLFALHYHLKQQSDLVLEECFKEDNLTQIGDPKLIIFPAAQMMTKETWELLVKYMKAGKTVLLSGCAELDQYGSYCKRFEELGMETEVSNSNSVEKVSIENNTYYTSFRECVGFMNPSKALNKVIYSKDRENKVRVFSVGKGKLIHCPLSLEIGDSLEAVVKLYEFAMKEAGVSNQICTVTDTEVNPSILLYPMAYQDSTLYTLVNEGEAASISFTDLATGTKIKAFVKGQRGAKLWIDKKGELLGAYINDKLTVNDREFIPEGDLVIFKENGQIHYSYEA